MENKYKNIEDLLEIGEKRNIKVFKANEWDNERGEFIKGTHKTGEVKNGKNKGKKYWMYNADVKYTSEDGKERRCTLFAFDKKTKELFDTGEVEAVCKEVVSYLADDFSMYPSCAMIEEDGKVPLIIPNKETGVMEPAKKVRRKVYFNQIKERVIEDGEEPLDYSDIDF